MPSWVARTVVGVSERRGPVHRGDGISALFADTAAGFEADDTSRCNFPEGSAMVPPMGPAPHRDAARLRARRRRPARRTEDRRARRTIVVVIVTTALVLTLLLTAFGSAATTARPLAAASALPGGRPQAQIVSTVGALRLQLPVAQNAVTAIGYHRAGTGALTLDPVGRQGNAGLLSRLWHRVAGARHDGLVWFQLSGRSGPGTSALDVGAAAGTDVYAPVDGVVVGITDFVVSNRVQGARIDIRPYEAPSVVVSLTHLRPDPALTVGAGVSSGRSKIGVLLDLSKVQYQALARHTQDAGNNVTIEVRPAATLSIR